MNIKASCRLSPGISNLMRHLENKYSNYILSYKNSICVRFASNKAAYCYDTKEPLKVDELKDMKLKKGEVKIKVRYCGLNPKDLLLLQGGIETKTPFVPGYEVTGEVVEIVKSETEEEAENPIEVGDKVVALTKSSLGGLSSHCVALEKDVWKYNSLEPKIAAGLVVNYGHALLSLFRRAKIKKDMTVLVTADSGGLGLAALDIAANVYKAKVVGVCSSEEKADLLRERGAWSAVKIDLTNMKAAVHGVTDKQGVDVVYETAGGDFLKGALQCVKQEGLVILGESFSTDDEVSTSQLLRLHSFNLTAISLDQYRTHNFPVYRQSVSDVIELCEQNLISPHISKVYDLENINEAFKLMKESRIIGKILVKMPITGSSKD